MTFLLNLIRNEISLRSSMLQNLNLLGVDSLKIIIWSCPASHGFDTS